MALTDEEFREEYKPLHIPAHFDMADTEQNKMIFALAELGEGTAEEVIAQLEKLEPGIINDQTEAFTKAVLADLFAKGKLSGSEKNGVVYYNLHKITKQNSGTADPHHKGLDLH